MSTGNTYRPNLDRDHTYLRTDDDLLFCVSGDSHTKDSIYGMPYYMATSQLEDVLGTSAQEQIIVKEKNTRRFLGTSPWTSIPILLEKICQIISMVPRDGMYL